MENNIYFSEILKELIEDTGLSLRKLEKETNVSSTQYSKYLRGALPTLEVAVRIANYFDCSLDYLFGLTDNKAHKEFKNYDLSNFVERYLKVLNANKTTHWKFSKKYNLSESCLRHWKYGDIPKIESLIVIAKNLSCSIDYLVGRSDIN